MHYRPHSKFWGLVSAVPVIYPRPRLRGPRLATPVADGELQATSVSGLLSATANVA